jgi:hypothetical protein
MKWAIREKQVMNMKWPVFLLCLVMCGVSSAQNKHSHSSEQLAFSAEDDAVKTPVAIPPDVLAILVKDELVSRELENESLSAEKIPLSWFSASAIHLSNSRKADFVVMARGPRAGGNVVTFWVFRSTSQGHEVVLTAPMHNLIVKNTRWKGYRDIELASMSAAKVSTVLCRFDGKQYKEYKSNLEDIQ